MERSTPKTPIDGDSPRTLRRLLAESPPRTFKLSRAWAPLLRGLRHARKAGEPVHFADRKALNRALDTPPLPDPHLETWVAELKQLLGAIARGNAGIDAGLAPAADAAIAALLPRAASAPLRLQIAEWPPGFGPAQRERLLGAPEHALRDPSEAADVVRALSGRRLGGVTLAVSAELGWNEALPTPTGRRQWRWGRSKPWLNVDEEGRWSLTPRHIAEAQAALALSDGGLNDGPVLDAFCGCGGNAVAFALAGLRVTTVELNPTRLAMARHNAARFGVQDRITFVRGDARDEVARRLTADTTVFLDPPWGGPGEVPLTWEALLPGWEAPAARLLVKVPAAFEPASAPASHLWSARYHFGEDGADDAGVVKLLTLVGEPR